MELNSAQANAALYALARHVLVMRAEMNAISSALAEAGIVSSDTLIAASKEALSHFDAAIEQMKSFNGPHSMEAIHSVDAFIELIQSGQHKHDYVTPKAKNGVVGYECRCGEFQSSGLHPMP